MLSQTVEYALRAMVYLASQAGEACTAVEIARHTCVPQAYLSKIMQGLTRAQLVSSQRGVRGGFRLAREPVDLTILEVVNAVDPIERIETCPLSLAGHGRRLCPLHRRLDQVLAEVERTLGETTLAEVLAEPGGSVPLCDVPGVTSPS